MSSFNTPILFLIFNRPDTTIKVFERIREIQPSKLFVAADGPRASKIGETEICNITKKIIEDGVDWDCKVEYLYREENIGCGLAVSSAITWFFENVDEGIILEDDCVPNHSFFKYCATLLERYRYESDILHIGGNNFQFGKKRSDGDYYFSTLGFIWGWATWKRAWKLYEFDLTKVDDINTNKFNKAFGNETFFSEFYSEIFEKMKRKEIDTWDYQWLHAIILNEGLTICPEKNLVENIGFGPDATHTTETTVWNDINHTSDLLSLNAPSKKEINHEADIYTLREIFGIKKVEEPSIIQKRNFKKNLLIKLKKASMLRRIWNKIKSKRPQVEKEVKWKEIEYFDEVWKNRIEMMAKYIKPDFSVLDLGCGKMWLKNFLAPTNTYFGSDYLSRSEDTIVCDFNKYEFPDKNVDCIFISGCMEYVNDVNWFVQSVESHSNYVVLSYCLMEHFPNLEVRKQNAWVNHLTNSDVIELFKKNNFELLEETITKTNNSIFFFKKNV